ENAIYHGVKQKRGKGEIVVNGYEEKGNICIEVIDNGSGMNRDKLNEIREELANNKRKSSIIGIGLRSVHERIKMHFGDDYGLTIESKEGTGTSSKVLIPMTKGGVNESA
ncbi:ATP-binding protein, partial [Neobacillus vireti]|uniref:sensor histidine kinase n=1 Tax=Neobacillus vireti TaxID=220686 RepID=UPI003000F0B4